MKEKISTYQILQLVTSFIAPLILVVGFYVAVKTDIAVNKEKITTIKEDISEIKIDIKEIKRLVK